MSWDGRSQVLLGALGLVAVANGAMLGLSLYAAMTAALVFLELPVPPFVLAVILGTVAGLAILMASLNRERKLCRADYGSWRKLDSAPQHDPSLAVRMTEFAASSTLRVTPALSVLKSNVPNAFAVGSSRDDAAVVVTDTLLDLLDGPEQIAVLAHELAHVEYEDIKAVGRADAIADCIDRAGELKGRVLWGPRRIFHTMWPFYLVTLSFGFILMAIPQPSKTSSGLAGLAYLLVLLALSGAFIAYMQTIASKALMGAVQLFLFLTVFGPLTLLEAALAAPTALALSRLISRTREYAADRRSVELTGDCSALISALQKLQDHACPPDRTKLRELRFALFVPTVEPQGWRGLIARLYATHPPISSRIEALRALME